MAKRTAVALLMLALVARAKATDANAPSAEISGTPTYTLSSDGTKMLFANPYDCDKPATESSTWVIAMEREETVFAFQVAVVDPSLVERELVTVRVGNNNPLTEGSSSNSLCAVADFQPGSAMKEFECDLPVTGSYISITRNDGGKMNVCGFSANLGTVALPPADAMAPVLVVPASELQAPASPAQNAAAYLVADANAPVSALPVLSQAGETKSFTSVEESVAVAPATAPTPSPALAPAVTLPLATSDVPAPAVSPTQEATVPTPAPATEDHAVPVPAPTTEVHTTPAPAPETERATTPAPAPETERATTPAPAPETQRATTPAPAPETERATVPAPALEALALAPVPAPVTLPRNVFTAEQPQPTQAADSSATPVPQTGSSTAQTSNSTDLSGGAIAGIVIGCLAGVTLLAAASLLYVVRRRRSTPSLSSRVNPTFEA